MFNVILSSLFAPVAQLDRASGFYPVCREFESLLGCHLYIALAQLDRVPGYEPVGRGFESLRARQKSVHESVRIFSYYQFVIYYDKDKFNDSKIKIYKSYYLFG